MTHSRRKLRTALAAGGIGLVAGCLGDSMRLVGEMAAGSDGPVVDLGAPCSEADSPVDLSGDQSPQSSIAPGLGLLVGVTPWVSVLSWRGPDACRLGAVAGTTAGVLRLVSGVACCGPQLLVIVGMQASAGLVAAMQ